MSFQKITYFIFAGLLTISQHAHAIQYGSYKQEYAGNIAGTFTISDVNTLENDINVRAFGNQGNRLEVSTLIERNRVVISFEEQSTDHVQEILLRINVAGKTHKTKLKPIPKPEIEPARITKPPRTPSVKDEHEQAQVEELTRKIEVLQEELKKQNQINEFKKRRLAERLAREEAERIAKEEAERKAREEAERIAKEEAERKAREEAERIAKEEAERKAREEAERIAKEEAERKAREEAERIAKEEAERKAREEAERIAKEEAERKAREEAERIAKEEAERKAREEAERIAKEEAERKAREEAELARKREILKRQASSEVEMLIASHKSINERVDGASKLSVALTKDVNELTIKREKLLAKIERTKTKAYEAEEEASNKEKQVNREVKKLQKKTSKTKSKVSKQTEKLKQETKAQDEAKSEYTTNVVAHARLNYVSEDELNVLTRSASTQSKATSVELELEKEQAKKERLHLEIAALEKSQLEHELRVQRAETKTEAAIALLDMAKNDQESTESYLLKLTNLTTVASNETKQIKADLEGIYDQRSAELKKLEHQQVVNRDDLDDNKQKEGSELKEVKVKTEKVALPLNEQDRNKQGKPIAAEWYPKKRKQVDTVLMNIISTTDKQPAKETLLKN